MAHTPLTPASRVRRSRSIVRSLLIAAPVAVLAGCTSLATREAEYRERKVALEPLTRDDSMAVAGIGVGED